MSEIENALNRLADAVRERVNDELALQTARVHDEIVKRAGADLDDDAMVVLVAASGIAISAVVDGGEVSLPVDPDVLTSKGDYHDAKVGTVATDDGQTVVKLERGWFVTKGRQAGCYLSGNDLTNTVREVAVWGDGSEPAIPMRYAETAWGTDIVVEDVRHEYRTFHIRYGRNCFTHGSGMEVIPENTRRVRLVARFTEPGVTSHRLGPGDAVIICDGPYQGYDGVILRVDPELDNPYVVRAVFGGAGEGRYREAELLYQHSGRSLLFRVGDRYHDRTSGKRGYVDTPLQAQAMDMVGVDRYEWLCPSRLRRCQSITRDRLRQVPDGDLIRFTVPRGTWVVPLEGGWPRLPEDVSPHDADLFWQDWDSLDGEVTYLGRPMLA